MHCISCLTPPDVNRMGVVTNGEVRYDEAGTGAQATFVCRTCAYPATPMNQA